MKMIRTRKKGWILLNQIPLLDEYRREGGRKVHRKEGRGQGVTNKHLKKKKD